MCDSRQLEKQIGKVQERYSSRWSGCLRAFASRLPLARSLDMDAYSLKAVRMNTDRIARLACGHTVGCRCVLEVF